MAQAEAKVGRGKAPNARLVKYADVGNRNIGEGEAPGVVSYGVEFVPQANGSILLTEKNEQRTYNRPNAGSRRLLVLPVGPGKPTVKLEEYTSGISRGEAHKARRLVISRKGQEGRFRVLFYPFRTTVEPAGKAAREDWEKSPLGAVLPSMSPATSGGFFLRFDEQKDQWTFTPGEDGRNRILLQRGSEQWQVD